MAVFDRIVMDIIDRLLRIVFIENPVLPEAPLPNPPFLVPRSACDALKAARLSESVPRTVP